MNYESIISNVKSLKYEILESLKKEEALNIFNNINLPDTAADKIIQELKIKQKAFNYANVVIDTILEKLEEGAI